MPAAKRILCIDVGASGLKAAVISPRGKYLVKRVRVKTPKHRKPAQIVKALTELAAPLQPFDHVTIGFPGMVRDGRVMTAPNFGTDDWRGFYLAGALRKRFAKPVRFEGVESADALLSNAERSHRLFGKPRVDAEQIIKWIGDWVSRGGATFGKPTHFEVRDGNY